MDTIILLNPFIFPVCFPKVETSETKVYLGAD